MKMDLMQFFINSTVFNKDSTKKFLIDVITESVDTKDFSLYDPEKKEWWQNESDNDNSQALTRPQDLYLNRDFTILIADLASDFVADLPKPILYQWMIQEETNVDRLMADKGTLHSQYYERAYLFKSRFKICESIRKWSLYEIAICAMEIQIFSEVYEQVRKNWDYLAEYFGEKNWYESEKYHEDGEPPVKTLADVGMSQKDFI